MSRRPFPSYRAIPSLLLLALLVAVALSASHATVAAQSHSNNAGGNDKDADNDDDDLFKDTPAASSSEEQLGTGRVVDLTDENFDALTAKGDWLIAFTAPWCGHCKTLAPLFEQAAQQAHLSTSSRKQPVKANDRFHFGKVDCTAHTATASKFSISGYPTIKYFSRGRFVQDYRLARSVQGLLDFANRVSGPPVHSLKESNKGEWADLLKKSGDALFVLVGARKALPDASFFAAFESSAKSLQTQLSFAHVADLALFQSLTAAHKLTKSSSVAVPDLSPASSFAPFVAVVKDGALHAVSLEAAGLPQSALFEKFVAENRFPLVAELSQSNYAALSALGKPLAVLIVDGTLATMSTYSSQVYGEFASAARAAAERPALKSFTQFAWMDGKTFAGFISNTFGYTAASLPIFLMWEPATGKFWTLDEKALSSPAFTKDVMTDFLERVASGAVASQGGNGIVANLHRTFRSFWTAALELYNTQPFVFFAFCLVPLALILVVYLSFSDDPQADFADEAESEAAPAGTDGAKKPSSAPGDAGAARKKVD